MTLATAPDWYFYFSVGFVVLWAVLKMIDKR